MVLYRNALMLESAKRFVACAETVKHHRVQRSCRINAHTTEVPNFQAPHTVHCFIHLVFVALVCADGCSPQVISSIGGKVRASLALRYASTQGEGGDVEAFLYSSATRFAVPRRATAAFDCSIEAVAA